MQARLLRNATCTLAVFGSFSAFAASAALGQGTGQQGTGQHGTGQQQQQGDTERAGPLPGPRATQPDAPNTQTVANDVQPVPGAMRGGQSLPSTMSAENAANDKLPIAAYTFKGLTDDQRRAIYQAVAAKTPQAAAAKTPQAAAAKTPQAAAAKTPNVAPPNGSPGAAAVGTVLVASVAVSPIPDQVTAQIPQTQGYEYAMAGGKVLLVSPVNRVVVGVIAQ